jgi:hypothetical protein
LLTWLVGSAAVWLLWRPASRAFFKPQGFTQAGHSAQPSCQVSSANRVTCVKPGRDISGAVGD